MGTTFAGPTYRYCTPVSSALTITTDTVPLYQVPQQQPTDTVPLYQVPQQQPTDTVPLYQVPQQ
jgi:hypothetical protein